MKLNYVGKKMNVGDTLCANADKKLGRLDKYFHDDVEGTVTFTTERYEKVVEVTIRMPGTILRTEESDEDVLTAIDRAVDSLESQIRKYKTKLQRRHTSGTIRFDNVEDVEDRVSEDEEPKIVRRKTIGLKPMDSEEAVLQMELLGHAFFVYLDADTDAVNVVYRRKDGTFGLITSEIQ